MSKKDKPIRKNTCIIFVNLCNFEFSIAFEILRYIKNQTWFPSDITIVLSSSTHLGWKKMKRIIPGLLLEHKLPSHPHPPFISLFLALAGDSNPLEPYPNLFLNDVRHLVMGFTLRGPILIFFPNPVGQIQPETLT